MAAYRASLQETTRERVPLRSALIVSNLGNALVALGERECGTARLGEAVAAYHAALEESTRERFPLAWAASFGCQGIGLMLIAARTNDAALAQNAVRQIEAAYETAREGGQEQSAAVFQERLVQARTIRDRLRNGK